MIVKIVTTILSAAVFSTYSSKLTIYDLGSILRYSEDIFLQWTNFLSLLRIDLLLLDKICTIMFFFEDDSISSFH